MSTTAKLKEKKRELQEEEKSKDMPQPEGTPEVTEDKPEVWYGMSEENTRSMDEFIQTSMAAGRQGVLDHRTAFLKIVEKLKASLVVKEL